MYTPHLSTHAPPFSAFGSKKLGSGSFGEIFLGQHVSTGSEVAVKLEQIRTQHPQLLYEAKVCPPPLPTGLPPPAPSSPRPRPPVLAGMSLLATQVSVTRGSTA